MNYVIRQARTDETDALTALTLRSKASWGYDTEFMRAATPKFTFRAERFAPAWIRPRWAAGSAQRRGATPWKPHARWATPSWLPLPIRTQRALLPSPRRAKGGRHRVIRGVWKTAPAHGVFDRRLAPRLDVHSVNEHFPAGGQ